MMSEMSASGAAGGEETAWDRAQAAFDLAFSRVESHQPEAQAPLALKEWGRNMSLTMFVGIVYGAAKESAAQKTQGIINAPKSLPNAALRTKFIQQANTRRVARMSNAMLSGGLHFGALGALFFGVQGASRYLRAEHDAWNTVLASTLSGAAIGAALPGDAAFKARSALLGAAVAGIVGYPVGAALVVLEPMVADEEAARVAALPAYLRAEEEGRKEAARLSDAAGEDTPPPGPKSAPIDAVIAQFESSLSTSPTAEDEEAAPAEGGAHPSDDNQPKPWWRRWF